jgi:hypothetical protein
LAASWRGPEGGSGSARTNRGADADPKELEVFDVVYELRSYYLLSDCIPRYLSWANNKALPLLQGQFGLRVVGFWRTSEVISTDGTAVNEDGPDVVWLLAWLNRAEREQRWTALESDELWLETVAEVVPFRRREGIVRFLQAIPRSILQ